MLVTPDIPGMQVPLPFRLLWIGTGVILFALANVNLAYLMAQPAGTTLSPVLSAVEAASGTEEEGALAEICSLRDVVCDGEIPVAVNPQRGKVLLDSPRPVVVGIKVDEGKMGALKQVCERHGMGDRCAKVLYAMHLTETGGDCSAVGDQGRSHGCFQIQLKMHKVAKKTATDLAASADWTLKRMMGNGFSSGFEGYAIRRHNGDGPMSFQYLQSVKDKLALIE